MNQSIGQASAKRKRGGFSLVELMITLAVGAVLLTIAVPSFKQVMSKTDVTQTGNDLVGDVATARTQAATREQISCLLPVGGDWLNGWQIMIDSDNNGSCGNGADELIRQRGALSAEYKMTVKRGATNVAKVVYGPDGTVQGATGDTDVRLCKKANGQAQRVIVTLRASGIANAHRDSSASGPNC